MPSLSKWTSPLGLCWVLCQTCTSYWLYSWQSLYPCLHSMKTLFQTLNKQFSLVPNVCVDIWVNAEMSWYFIVADPLWRGHLPVDSRPSLWAPTAGFVLQCLPYANAGPFLITCPGKIKAMPVQIWALIEAIGGEPYLPSPLNWSPWFAVCLT